MPSANSSDRPGLSIAIPFYNPGRYFRPALQSVFAQTFADWELLLIDDGSTDGSLELSLRIVDPRVRVVADGKNRGLSYRLNQAAQMARGEYLFRMDADDIMHPDRLASQLSILTSSSSSTVVGTACYSIDQETRVVGWRPATAKQSTGYSARHSFDHPTVAASTKWFRSNPYSEERVLRRAEDAELWCRTASYSEFKWIAKPLLFYREQGLFSLDNYLSGQAGLLYLIEQLDETRSRRMWLSAKERAKMALAWAFDNLDRSDLFMKHRYMRLTRDQQREAEDSLGLIEQTDIPLK